MTVNSTIKSRYLLKVTSLLLFLCVWQVASFWIDVDILPSPGRVASSIYEHLLTGELLSSVVITLARVAASFFIAMAFGISWAWILSITMMKLQMIIGPSRNPSTKKKLSHSNRSLYFLVINF